LNVWVALQTSHIRIFVNAQIPQGL